MSSAFARKMLSGLRSLCTMPAACAFDSARAAWPMICPTSRGASGPRSMIASDSDSPSRNSITM